MTSRTAWGHGLATITTSGTVLDTWYPSPVLGDHDGSDLPAALREARVPVSAAVAVG